MNIGDSHNFGKRVHRHVSRGNLIFKPRTVFWEWLFFGKSSRFFRAVSELCEFENSVPGLDFEGNVKNPWMGSACEVHDEEISGCKITPSDLRVAGALLAYCQAFGLTDLHNENVFFGSSGGRIWIQPIDIECVLARSKLPSETHLVPNHTYKNYAICGYSRLFQCDALTSHGDGLVRVAIAYADAILKIKSQFKMLDELLRKEISSHNIPIRVILRETKAYRRHLDRLIDIDQMTPEFPLEYCEKEQLHRNDIPYFFRNFGSPDLFYCTSEDHKNKKAHFSQRLLNEAFPPLLEENNQIKEPDLEFLRHGVAQILSANAFCKYHLVELDGWSVSYRGREIKCKMASGEKFRFMSSAF